VRLVLKEVILLEQHWVEESILMPHFCFQVELLLEKLELILVNLEQVLKLMDLSMEHYLQDPMQLVQSCQGYQD